MKAIAKQRVSMKIQTLQALAAIVAAVALPQLVHVFGIATGLGAIPGAVLLPMHLPIMLVGMLAGPFAGAAAGLLGPVVSFALTGMPTLFILPFMMVELCVYGIVAGLLRTTKVPVLAQVLMIQVAGRLARAAVIAVAVSAFDLKGIKTASVFLAVKSGIPGIVAQLILLPVIVMLVNRRRTENE